MNMKDADDIRALAGARMCAWMRSLYAAHPELEASSSDAKSAAADALAWGAIAGVARQRCEDLLRACGGTDQTVRTVLMETDRYGRSLPRLDILRTDDRTK